MRATGLLVMDVDSTLVKEEVIDLLGAEVGVGEQVAAITKCAMQGKYDFEAALLERVTLLKGLPGPFLNKFLRKFILLKGLDS